MDRTCDGTVDCPDGSDETHHLCRNNGCPDDKFRCTYGACVNGTAVCNSVGECADNSDELQPRCLNDTRIIGSSSQFKCDDGNLIELYMLCDGVEHCRDGTDEILRSCAGHTCTSNSFQCAYGACIREEAECDYINDCADGSDESDFLCNEKKTTTTAPQHIPAKCILPFHLKNGHYLKNGVSPMYNPGDAMDTVFFNVTCQPGFKLDGNRIIVCFNGYWSYETPPRCIRACEVPDAPGVSYRCLVPGGSGDTRDCEDLEPEGTIVKPECNPNYYSRTGSYMECVDGVWKYEHKCHAECGTLGPKGERGEFPWLAVVYQKFGNSFQHNCIATLINEDVLLSAAHCFWKEGVGKLLEYNFAIAVGKLHSEWNHPDDDQYEQKSDVKEIALADRYDGIDQNYQYDFAVVFVKNRFRLQYWIKPACLDLSHLFNKDDNQYDNGEINMADGTIGKVAIWTGDRSPESSVLKVVDMPYVTFEECKKRVPKDYVEILMGDKFCAGFADGTSVCEGASGGGWFYTKIVGGEERYYLGGILSTKPRTADGSCNGVLASFTDIFKHAQLIGQYRRE